MNQQDKLAHLRKLGDESAILRRATVEKLGEKILETADLLSGVIGAGGKIMLAGNGGSLALATHFASELVVRLSSERNRQALPAVTIGVNPALVSAASNDFGWEHVFARQVEALGNKGDMLMLISTSGNAANLIRAAQTAREKRILTAALLGATGGGLKGAVERSLIVPHTSPQRVHEEHLFIIHLLAEHIERDLFV